MLVQRVGQLSIGLQPSLNPASWITVALAPVKFALICANAGSPISSQGPARPASTQNERYRSRVACLYIEAAALREPGGRKPVQNLRAPETRAHTFSKGLPVRLVGGDRA